MALGIDISAEDRKGSLRMLGFFLIVGFFFPISMPYGYGSSRWVFFNIEMLGKANTGTDIALLYPLLAGIAIYIVSKQIETIVRPLVALGLGVIPFLYGIVNSQNIASPGFGWLNKDMLFMLLIILSLIGIHAGAKLLAEKDHISGRRIGGISAIIFLALILLPIGSGNKPFFFSLFDIFNTSSMPFGNVSGGLKFVGVIFILVFIAYIWAAVTGIINLGERPNSLETSWRAQRVVFYASLAIPVAIFLGLIFSELGFMILLTIELKLALLIGGVIGLLAIGTYDLVNFFLAETVKGSDLLKRPTQQQP